MSIGLGFQTSKNYFLPTKLFLCHISCNFFLQISLFLLHFWSPEYRQTKCNPQISSWNQGWGQFNSGIGIAAQFQFQFRNWNWNWWNWKWNWNRKPWNWNWNWKLELNFVQLLPQQLLVNQPFPNFSFNRGSKFKYLIASYTRGGHSLSCDWLFMQQVFKRHLGSVACSPWVDRGQKD